MENPYEQNAFAVLQLSPSATNAEIIEKAEEMEALIEIGEITGITKSQVVQARRQLLLSHKRIREELFCSFLGTSDISELQALLERWSTNPLLDEESNVHDQEDWTEEEIQNDFSSMEDLDGKFDTARDRFDDQNAELKPARFLMESLMPVMDLRE